MDDRIQIITILGTALLLLVVLELVRRRKLLERYALLWLASSVILLALAVWRDALDRLAEQLGVASPPNALFLVGFAAVLWLLLHFSVAVSRLNDQTKVLAQRQAILEERLRRTEEAAHVRRAGGPHLAEVEMVERPRPMSRVHER